MVAGVIFVSEVVVGTFPIEFSDVFRHGLHESENTRECQPAFVVRFPVWPDCRRGEQGEHFDEIVVVFGICDE